MIRVVSAGIAIMLAPSQSSASQCQSDSDCPSNRACLDGSCLFRPIPSLRTRRAGGGDDWAFAAGVTGIVSSVAALSLGLASEVLMDPGTLVPALPLGAGASLVVAITVPIVAAGASSAREKADVSTSTFLRILGWATFGITMTSAAVLVGVGIGSTLPSGLITATTLVGTGSLVLMSIDAFNARNEALVTPARREVLREPSPGGFALTPFLRQGRDRGVLFSWTMSL